MDNANRQDTLNYKIEPKDSFGASLKRERELRSIPLEDVAEATNIQVSYLKALEEDSYEFLPHITFVRGFIRSYARYIGLNPDNVMANYEHFMASLPKDDTSDKTVEFHDKKSRWLLVAVVSGSLLILSLLGYYLMVSMQAFKESKTSARQVQPVAPSDFGTPPNDNQIDKMQNDGENIPFPPTFDPNLQNSAQPE